MALHRKHRFSFRAPCADAGRIRLELQRPRLTTRICCRLGAPSERLVAADADAVPGGPSDPGLASSSWPPIRHLERILGLRATGHRSTPAGSRAF